MAEKIKVKMLHDDANGLIKGNIYDAFIPSDKNPPIFKEPVYSVIDYFGEEYAYPADWFEIVK